MKKTLVACTILCTLCLSALSADYFVTVSPQTISSGQSTYIAYSSPTSMNAWDWVGIYPKGNPLQMSKLFFSYGSRSNGYSFQFNSTGEYEIRYYHKSGIALSSAVTLVVSNAPGVYQLGVSTNRVFIGDELVIHWESATNVNIEGDVVVLSSASNPNMFTSVPVWSHSGAAYWIATPPGAYDVGYYKQVNSSLVLVSSLERVTVERPPLFVSFSKTGSGLILRWSGYAGATYQVRSSTNTSTPRSSWPIAKTINGVNGVLSYTNATTGVAKFFSVNEVWN